MFFCGDHFGEAAAVFGPESSRRELGAPLPGLSLFLAAKKGAVGTTGRFRWRWRFGLVARLRLQLRFPRLGTKLAGYLNHR